jgi:kynureninase
VIIPTLADVRALDAADPLGPLRDLFDLPDGLTYLDGNSLGALPRATAGRLHEVVTTEWGRGLIRSWDDAHWFDAPRRLGDKLAPLIGAAPGEVAVSDCTSVNLYKALHAAMSTVDPERSIIVVERDAFPTDRYVAQAVAHRFGADLHLVERDNLYEALSPHVGVLLVSEIDYRTGHWCEMAEVTASAHHEGIVTVWDLCHSVGAVPIDVHAAHADYAVGCTYKYLNGGPGAPAFVWSHPRHADRRSSPITGWWSHAEPFAMSRTFTAGEGATAWLTGAQPILALAALDCGLDTVLAGAPAGEMSALRAKSVALTELFLTLVDARLGDQLEVITQRDPTRRGSQVSLAHPDAYGVVQALAARGVVGDVRGGSTPDADLARFGFAPLYTRFVDVWQAVDQLAEVLGADEHKDPAYAIRRTVT